MATGHPQRCTWAGDDPLMQAYHDQEWGVPSTTRARCGRS
jgi:DNA-3-methyladenine glycosylase I